NCPALRFLATRGASMTNRLTSGARNSASMIGNMRANLAKEVATERAGDTQSSAGACIGPDRQLASRKARRAWCTYHTKKRAIVATEKGAGSETSKILAVRHKRSQKQIGRAGHVIVVDCDCAGLLGHGDGAR